MQSALKAMVAAHGKVVAIGIGIDAAFDLANTPPAEIGGVTVLLVAGDLAGAAADAFGHIEMKAILLASFESRCRE